MRSICTIEPEVQVANLIGERTGVIPRGCWRHPHNAADARRRIKQEYIDPGVSQTEHDQASVARTAR
jgi:hypothetical protein